MGVLGDLQVEIAFVLICMALSFLAAASHDSMSFLQRPPLKRFASNSNPPKRSPGFAFPRHRVLTKKTPLNVLRNGPYYVDHYVYSDDFNPQSLDHVKLGSFPSGRHLQLEKDKFYTISSTLSSLRDANDFNNLKTEGYAGDKEIHILHLPKEGHHDYEDIKLHLSLTNAHETPEINLDFNKNLGNFEVNIPSIKPPEVDTSFVPTPTTSFIDLVKPLIQSHIFEPPYKYFEQLPHFFGKDGPSGHATDEESLEIPHIETHPLENDYGKSSYDTPGAVNSYGQPIKQGSKQGSTNTNPSAVPSISSFTYNSPGAVDSYGNAVTDQALAHLSSKITEDFYQQQNYLNQLNEIHGHLNKRKRQSSGRPKGEVRLSSGGVGEEMQYSNHKYDRRELKKTISSHDV
ncbi:uncharacterized protein [Euwallacea fornicatus]|uniref:uncharacterized protein n=1 Tax=Euwallacea fornicatus TaxID=995702 RepID=UPI00338F40A8